MPSPSILAQEEEEIQARAALAGDAVDPLWYESSADREKRLHPVYITMDVERLTNLAYTVAGAATGPLLRDNPGYVFPSERVGERVRDVMREFGVEPAY
jgi:hypothetical protein